MARIGGHRRGAAAVLPVTSADLLGPAKEYHAYVTAGLDTLASQVATLTGLIRAGHLGAARRAWLPAHLTYERLGAAYGTFGNYDTEIDGRPDGLPEGSATRPSPASTGWSTACGTGRARPSWPARRRLWITPCGSCARCGRPWRRT